MTKNKSIYEKVIKKLIIKVHREIFGKGPEEVWVSINRNVASFHCSKSLTALEKYLLKELNAKDEVERLRQVIMQHIYKSICSELQNACNNTVLGLTMKLCVDTDILFGAILFQNSFCNGAET